MISISKADEIKKVIDVVSSFISEANLRFNEQGISLKAVDQSQIALVDFLIPKKAFEIFKIESGLVGLNLEELNKVLQRINPTDKLELNLKDSFLELNVLDEMKRKFTLPLIDVTETELELPKVKYDFELVVPARLVKEALKDAGIFSSSVLLKIKSILFDV